MIKRKVMIIHLIIELIKKIMHRMIQYFSKSYDLIDKNVKIELDLSNYATGADVKRATGIDTSNLPLKSNLAKLKAEPDKIKVHKIKTFSVDVSKLSNVVNNVAKVAKKTVYDTLVAKVINIDEYDAKYDTEKSYLEKKFSDVDIKISDTCGLVKKTDYNAKITKI